MKLRFRRHSHGSPAAALRSPRWLLVIGLAITAIDLYLLLLLLGAAARRRPPLSPAKAERDDEPLRFVVLVPAHDEEALIAQTVAALKRMAYPPSRWRAVVIADNCRDATAELAAGLGTTVLERHDPDNRGKGHALNWALDRLGEVEDSADAIAIVDADCEASPNLLESFDRRLRNGAGAVQTRYVVANPNATTHTALRFAAFALMNTVRPLGKDRLGLSCGLLGTGMAFRRSLLERHRFSSVSLVEDSELHLRLVAAGERIVFAPEASVRSAMPTTERASRSQQSRWEGGRIDLLRDGLPLVLAGVRHGDPVRLHAGLEHIVPSQAVLALMHASLGALALSARYRTGQRIAVVNTALQALFVLGGLRMAEAPPAVYRALGAAPLLMAQKSWILVGILLRGAPRTWERTARAPSR